MTSGPVGMVRQALANFWQDDASTLAAAIAYSAVFAIAPLIIIAIAVAGSLLGLAGGGESKQVVEDQLIAVIAQSAGRQTATTVRAIVDTTFSSKQTSVFAQIVGWITFAIASSSLFLSLQNALNRVWHVVPRQTGIFATLRNHLSSAAMVLIVGALVLATLLLDFAVAFVWGHLTALIPIPGSNLAAAALKYLVDLVIVTLMFAAMFKVLPDTDITWNDVFTGALISGVLFVLGEIVLSIYLARAGIANAYGAVGSLVVLLVWAYYSAMLLLFGAEFTRVFAERRGSRSFVARVQAVAPPSAPRI
jgi:membrane protein